VTVLGSVIRRGRYGVGPTAGTPVLVLLTALVLSGCLVSRELTQMKRQIERDVPEAEFDRDLVLNIGPAGLRLIGWTAGLSSDEDAEEVRRYISYVDRVRIGVFETRRLPEDWMGRVTVIDDLQNSGWLLAVRRESKNELLGVLYRERVGRIRDIYAVHLDPDELILARISGDLQGLLDYAVADNDGFASLISP
jgi:hypothetical protein